MENSNELFDIVKSVLGWIAGALLMIVLGVSGTAYSQLREDQNKLEERVLVLQKDSVTEDKLKDMESRINSNMAREVGLIRNEMSQTNMWLQRIIEESKNSRK
ncbi:hypothetical protein D3C80_1114850 [compost metagenome]